MNNPTKNQGAVTKALDELAADLDKRLGQPLSRALAVINQIREMRFRPELEEQVAKELLRLKGMGYRDAQIERSARNLETVRNTLASMAIR
jgi:hypothetical protein